MGVGFKITLGFILSNQVTPKIPIILTFSFIKDLEDVNNFLELLCAWKRETILQQIVCQRLLQVIITPRLQQRQPGNQTNQRQSDQVKIEVLKL